ncbi:hypothetical protein WJX73_002232 [Symbiochloris irregularis]|uniref:GH18 domain-containing protein n=1 Tax=Symbiochloris irregularis TaxID=706552 RepID=A0AAW1P4L1_9CHLO
MTSKQMLSVAGALCLVLVSASAVSASTINEYLGANPHGLKTVALDSNYESHIKGGLAWNVILGFARSDGTGSGVAGSNFQPHWDTNTLTPDAILAFRKSLDNVRVIFSIGGDGETWQEQSDCGQWSDDALKSINSIVTQYNLDGVDLDYESGVSGSASFASCISQLATKFKAQTNTIPGPSPTEHLVTMAPFGNTNAEYADAYSKAPDSFDLINYQAYADESTTSTSNDYLTLYSGLTKQYPTIKLMLGVDTNTQTPRGQQFVPGSNSQGILGTFNLLENKLGSLGGVFFFTAEDSAEDGGSNGSNGFAAEDAFTQFILTPGLGSNESCDTSGFTNARAQQHFCRHIAGAGADASQERSQISGMATQSSAEIDCGTADEAVAEARSDMSDRSEEAQLLLGWRHANQVPSLPDVHGSVSYPKAGGRWWGKLAAFFGVGFMVSVGYMDPGNWATDLEGGSAYGYILLIVIFLANCMAMYLQALALKLGVVGERDLAQACRDDYPGWLCKGLWVIMEIAIAATDLAEVIGSATALYLLFNIPIWAGVLITAVDVLIVLVMGMKNFRLLEVIVFLLIMTILGIFIYQLAVANPNWADVGKGFIPRARILTDPAILFVAIGIVGATVMPHNLYLHSAIIQTRGYPRTMKGKRSAIKWGAVDSTVSLAIAFFINASILILAGAAFFYNPQQHGTVASLTDAYQLLSGAVGAKAAKILFAVALLAAGQNSTITSTLAGQIVMEGYLHIRLKPWLRRAITRGIAIIPAAIISGVMGNNGAARLLILSQVILSLALPFAVIPLVQFTSSRRKMGRFVNGWIVTIIGVLLSLIITGLNVYLIISTFTENQFGQAYGAA